MPYRLLLPRIHFEAMLRHGRETLPNECCGFLVGRLGDGVGTVEEAIPLTNQLDSSTRYRADVSELLEVQKRLRASGLQELAVYHSHPSSPPIPSRTDLANNGYGDTIVHLIIGFEHELPEVRGWWLQETDYHEAEWLVE